MDIVYRCGVGAPAGPEPRRAVDEQLPVRQAPEDVGDGSGLAIVGIGASAGGLRALRGLFASMPSDTGMAFVVVSHHLAGHKSLLPELLGQTTTMRVDQASGGMVVEPDRVYVAPPGSNLAIADGVLRLVAPAASRGPPLPIDAFLCSLAGAARERAVAIILSGTGSDGTLGVKAVKAGAGLVLVQTEKSAEFPGMPASAIATGLADFVVSPEEMCGGLLRWARGSYLVDRTTLSGPETADAGVDGAEFRQILARLDATTGHDFSGYKQATLYRRIQGRQALHQLDRLQDYARFLQEHEEEVYALFQDLLIGVTRFFRDPDAFASLTEPLFALLAARADHASLRVWIPGCSTGEEAYSLAILIHECIGRLHKPLGVQIFASDVDPRAIESARQGRYAEGIAADVSAERLARFFTREDGGYRIGSEIRSMIVFATHDVPADPPFTRLDLVSCRNLLIYLDPELQRRVLELFHYALSPGGLLLLGSSESTTSLDGLFTPLSRRWKLYRRRETARGAIGLTDLPAHRRAARAPGVVLRPPSQSDSVQHALARTFAPPSVLVTERAEIVHVHGRTGAFLEPAQGRASVNLLEMAREGLRAPLSDLLRAVRRTPEQPAERSAHVRTNGEQRRISLVARKLAPPDPLSGLILVSFQELSAAPGSGRPPGPGEARREGEEPDPEPAADAAAQAAQILELQRTRSDLQASIEELENANEELAAGGEELQSANEELEASREEIQSLNEELQTLNAELRAKLTALSEASDDLLNLLSSTAIATLFLDRDLCIKRFTAEVAGIIPLKPSDLGRPLADFAAHVEHQQLASDATEVLRTLVPQEKEVRSDDGETTYLVRIRAYRTAANAIDGVVMTFVDITRLKQLEAAQEAARTHAEAIVETVRQPLITLDGELRVCSVNRAFCMLFGTSAAEVVGREIFDLPGTGWDVRGLRRLLEDVIPSDGVVEDYELACDLPATGRRTVRVDARRMPMGVNLASQILLAISPDA